MKSFREIVKNNLDDVDKILFSLSMFSHQALDKLKEVDYVPRELMEKSVEVIDLLTLADIKVFEIKKELTLRNDK